MSLLVEIIIVVLLLFSLLITKKIKSEENLKRNKILLLSHIIAVIILQSYLGTFLISEHEDNFYFYLFPIEFFILGIIYEVVLPQRIESKKFNLFYSYYKTTMLICFLVLVLVSSQNSYAVQYIYLLKLSMIFANLVFLIRAMIYLQKKKLIINELFFLVFTGLLLNTLHVIYNIVSICFGIHKIWNVFFVNLFLLITCFAVVLYKAFVNKEGYFYIPEESNTFDPSLPSEPMYEMEEIDKTSTSEILVPTMTDKEMTIESFVNKPVLLNKYEKSKLKQSDIEMIRLKIYEELVKNKAFLDPELNLQKFSDAIKVSKHSISQVFSTYYQSNFKEFTNKLRCEYAIELMSKYHDKHIIEIAYLCGFNSKTSFYRSFNKNFNISPSDYISKNNR